MNRFFFKLPILVLCLLSFSCVENKPANFSVRGTNALLLAQSRHAREGTLDFSKPKKLEYRFEDSFYVLSNSSLEIYYEFSVPLSEFMAEKISLVLNTGEASWELPLVENRLHYSVPVGNSFNGLSITLESNEKIDKNAVPVFKINSLRFVERWFGFYRDEDNDLFLSPFIFSSNHPEYGYNASLIIDVPSSFLPAESLAEIEAVFASGAAALEFEGRRIDALPGTKKIYIPPAMFPFSGQAVLSGNEIESFRMVIREASDVFPIPVIADPALILECPKENWREKNYEVFRWDRFPLILIFDTADYAVQDRLFKRLAFFVEKAGYRGSLVTDAEVADIRGWNAHDYRAEDLARFFDTVAKQRFPLSDEERELKQILLNEKIIRESGGSISAGTGGILSISRESPEYLRYRLLAHEGFHGLFFIDEDFRDFSRRRWEQLHITAKTFIILYFDFEELAYDTTDEYLMVNEFMAYILQQTVSQTGDYFGKFAPSRLENSWRNTELPPKDAASGTWPFLAETFCEEAEAFSAYVNRRWGLTGGSIWGLRVE